MSTMHTEWMHRNASGGGSIHQTREDAEAARDRWVEYRPAPVDEPPRPQSVGVFYRTVSEWFEVNA